MNSEEEIKLPEILIKNEKEENSKTEPIKSTFQVDEIFNLENITINNKVLEEFQKGEEIENKDQTHIEDKIQEIARTDSIEERKKIFVKKQGNSLKNIHEISQVLQKAKIQSSTDLDFVSLYSPIHKKKVKSEIMFASLSNHEIENSEENDALKENPKPEKVENAIKPDKENYGITPKEQGDIKPTKKIKKPKHKKKNHVKAPLSDIYEQPMEEREDFKLGIINEEIASETPLTDSLKTKLDFNQRLFFSYVIVLYSTNMILTLIEFIRSKISICEDYFSFFNFLVTIVIKVISLNLFYLEIQNENLVETFFPFEPSILVFFISPSLQIVQFTFDSATDEFVNPLFSSNFACNVNRAFGIIIIMLSGLAMITLCFTSRFERNNRLGRLENCFFKNSLLLLVIFMGFLSFLLELSQVKNFLPALFMEAFGLFFFLGIGINNRFRKNNKIEDEKMFIGKIPVMIAKGKEEFDIKSNPNSKYRKVKTDSDGGSNDKGKEDV